MVISVVKAWPALLKLGDRAPVALPMVAKPAAAITSQASVSMSSCRSTKPASRIIGPPARPGPAAARAHLRAAGTGRLPAGREHAYNEKVSNVNAHDEVTQ